MKLGIWEKFDAIASSYADGIVFRNRFNFNFGSRAHREWLRLYDAKIEELNRKEFGRFSSV
jgi:hypothetical protein